MLRVHFHPEKSAGAPFETGRNKTGAIPAFARGTAASGQRPRIPLKAKQARHIKRHPPIPADKEKPDARFDKGHTRKSPESPSKMPRRRPRTRALQKRTRFPSTAMRYANACFLFSSSPAPPCRSLQFHMLSPHGRECGPPFEAAAAQGVCSAFSCTQYTRFAPAAQQPPGTGRGFVQIAALFHSFSARMHENAARPCIETSFGIK